MHVRQHASQLIVTTPAKLNLFLEVLAKRNDGFHEIETLMLPVALYDTLYFRDEPKGPITLQCEWRVGGQACPTESDQLPAADENLVTRAVELIRRDARVEHGASLRLVKRIPLAAGLAGGSSDAAAALAAANQAWSLGYSVERLTELASQLGSDVPFFLGAGPAICRGRGERIEPVAPFGPLHFVIVRPPVGLSTAAVYKACRPAATPLHAAALVAAAERGDVFEVGRRLHNRLQPAAASLTPWIDRLRKEFGAVDVIAHQLTGSGTAYFGLCRHRRHALRVAARLRQRSLGQAFAVPSHQTAS